jgi:hypothetical protein
MWLIAQAAEIDWIAATKELGFPIAICLILLFSIGSFFSAMGYVIWRVCQWLRPYVERGINNFVNLMVTLQDSAIKHDDINARTTVAIEKLSANNEQSSLNSLEIVKQLKDVGESQRALMSTAGSIAGTMQEMHLAVKSVMEYQAKLNEQLPLIAIRTDKIQMDRQ